MVFLLYSRSTVEVLQEYCSTPAVLPQYSPSCPPVLPLYFRSTLAVLPQYSLSTPSVLLQCSCSTRPVLPQYSRSNPSVLPQVLLQYSRSTPAALPGYSCATGGALKLDTMLFYIGALCISMEIVSHQGHERTRKVWTTVYVGNGLAWYRCNKLQLLVNTFCAPDAYRCLMSWYYWTPSVFIVIITSLHHFLLCILR